jgi:hypothetical protein
MLPAHPPGATIASVALLFLGAATAQACESYYVLVFAYQDRPNLARKSHTFATFVKATHADDQVCLEYHTISWLPQTLDVKNFKLRPEAGQNLTLEETLENAERQGLRVSMWGPYEIKPRLYQRGLDQVGRLESGRVRYKGVDTGFPTSRVTNCIHAVSDTVFWPRRLRVGTPAYGEAASYRVLLRLARYLVKPGLTHDWVADALGLDAHAITRRHLRQFWLWFPRP